MKTIFDFEYRYHSPRNYFVVGSGAYQPLVTYCIFIPVIDSTLIQITEYKILLDMHPDIASGMGIATELLLGIDSS